MGNRRGRGKGKSERKIRVVRDSLISTRENIRLLFPTLLSNSNPLPRPPLSIGNARTPMGEQVLGNRRRNETKRNETRKVSSSSFESNSPSLPRPSSPQAYSHTSSLHLNPTVARTHARWRTKLLGAGKETKNEMGEGQLRSESSSTLPFLPCFPLSSWTHENDEFTSKSMRTRSQIKHPGQPKPNEDFKSASVVFVFCHSSVTSLPSLHPFLLLGTHVLSHFFPPFFTPSTNTAPFSSTPSTREEASWLQARLFGLNELVEKANKERKRPDPIRERRT